MGLPEIFIQFQTAAVTAISRSARGTLAVAVKDATKGGSAQAVYRTLSEVPQEQFTAENHRLLKLAFLASPAKVIVLRAGAESAAAFQTLEKLDFDWLAAPGLPDAEVLSFIKTQRAGGRGVKAVVANAAAPDCEGIVNLWAGGLVLEDGAIDARNYTVRIAALLAALPLTRSATYTALPEVADCAAVEDADGAVDEGKLILIPSPEGYRLGRAVNSLTTLTPVKAALFQKIKIVEGIDLIRRDIAKAFESGYVGRVLNDYDNKLLLVTAINAYFRELEGEVLDKTADNRCAVSFQAQQRFLEAHGTDTSGMKDAEILRANTGSQVFLEARLTFCDAMEDLALVIAME